MKRNRQQGNKHKNNKQMLCFELLEQKLNLFCFAQFCADFNEPSTIEADVQPGIHTFQLQDLPERQRTVWSLNGELVEIDSGVEHPFLFVDLDEGMSEVKAEVQMIGDLHQIESRTEYVWKLEVRQWFSNLIVDQISVSEPRNAEGVSTVTALIQNLGPGDAEPFDVQFLVNGVLAGTTRTSFGLPAGQQDIEEFQLVVDTEGMHEISVIVDAMDEIPEQDGESDNTTSALFEWDEPLRSDITIHNLQVQRLEGVNRVRITVAMANRGEGHSRPFDVAYFLDGQWQGSDRLDFGIDVNKIHFQSIELPIDLDVRHEIRIVVDSNSELIELPPLGEENNIAFVLTGLPLGNGDVDANGIVNASDVDALRNAGRDLIRVRTFLDLNKDAQIDEDDVLILIDRLMQTSIGDVNLDGIFEQLDLDSVFENGRYESDNSATYGEGDWNGDGIFNSTDIVYAFSFGTYALPGG